MTKEGSDNDQPKKPQNKPIRLVHPSEDCDMINGSLEDFYVNECHRFGIKISSSVYIFLKFQLSELEIRSEQLTDKDLLPLAKVVKSITFKVKHLNFSHCKFSANGLRLVLDFCYNHPIVCLILKGNPIKSAGVRILLELLTDPRCCINYLGLSNIDMDWKIAEDLAKTLRINRTLIGLDVSKNYLGYRGRYIIEAALKEKARVIDTVDMTFHEAHKEHSSYPGTWNSVETEDLFVAARKSMIGLSNKVLEKIEESWEKYQAGQPLTDLRLADIPDIVHKSMLTIKDGFSPGKIIGGEWLFKKHILISFEGNYMIEEIFNTCTHMMGIVLSIIGALFLLPKCKSAQELFGCWIFTIGMLCCYASSTLFHGFLTSPKCSTRCINALQKMDYCGIFLLISATYTPLLLVPLGNHPFYSVTLLIWVWVLAAVGIGRSLYAVNTADLKSVRPVAIAIGWSGSLLVVPLITHFGIESIYNICYGGLCYMGGIYFLYMERYYPLYHSAWHLCVIGGTIMHYKAIESFILNQNLRVVEEQLSMYNMTVGGFESIVLGLLEYFERYYYNL